MLELRQQVSNLDVVREPVGGGGLLSGLRIAAHHLNLRLLLYACDPLGAADVIESLCQNEVVPMTTPPRWRTVFGRVLAVEHCLPCAGILRMCFPFQRKRFWAQCGSHKRTSSWP